MKYSRRFSFVTGFDFDDYMSAAYFGLVHAARKFDPSRGFTFKTYAFNWCERYLGELSRAERRANGWARQPNTAEIAAGANRSSMVKLLRRAEAPEHNANGEPNDIGIEALLPATVERHVDRIDQREQIERIIACGRTRQERTVLRGLARGLNHREIGERLGVSHQRVWQIEGPLLDRIRRKLRPSASHGAEPTDQ